MKPHPRTVPGQYAALAAATLLASVVVTTDAPAQWKPSGFVVGGYHHTREGDSQSRFDPARLLRLEAAGIRVLVAGSWFDSTEARATVRMLDSLRARDARFGMRALILYTRPANPSIVSFNPAMEGNWWAVRDALQPEWGINSPSVEGYVVWDEPSRPEHFDNILRTATLIDTLPATRGKLPFVNLFPIYVSGQQAFDELYGRQKVAAYERYLDRYLSTFAGPGRRAPLLCVDHYPFQTPATRRDYSLNLRLMREATERFSPPGDRIPMWIVIQLSAFRVPPAPFPSGPSLAQVRWQAWTALAYGVKGILYWTLVPGVEDHFGEGLLRADGMPTAGYGELKRLNEELLGVGPTLMKLEPVAVYHQSAAGDEGLGSDLLGAAGRPRGVLEDMTGGSNRGLVGLLRGRAAGEDYLLVVNKDLSAARTFSLRLAPGARAVERVTAAGAAAAAYDPATRTFATPALAAGAGALYRIVR